MNVYIAGKYTAKERLQEERKRLRSLGFKVMSTWLDEEVSGTGDPNGYPPHLNLANAERDRSEIAHADIFIIDTQDESLTGGREVELGMALARRDTLVYRVGPQRNVFHSLATGTYDSWDELIGSWS